MKSLIDISQWQGKIDFSRVKDQVDGIMIRAGYGAGNIDKEFVRNVTECNKHGIPCGVYWFSYAYTEQMAKDEAKACINAIKPYKIEYPVAFDWEYDSERVAKERGVNVTSELTNLMAHCFCDAIEDAGYYAMVYTNPDMRRRYFNDCNAYDTWLASWGTKMPVCGIWQYGVTKIDGISGEVDGDKTTIDYPELIASAGLNHLSSDLWQKEKFDAVRKWAEDNGFSKDRSLNLTDLIQILEMLGVVE